MICGCGGCSYINLKNMAFLNQQTFHWEESHLSVMQNQRIQVEIDGTSGYLVTGTSHAWLVVEPPTKSIVFFGKSP